MQRTKIDWLLGMMVECPDCDGLGEVRGVSYEPILEAANFSDYLFDISWLIAGGESGRDARPCRLEWIDSIVEQCQAAGTSVMVKQLGANPWEGYQSDGARAVYPEGRFVELNSKKGGSPEEWPGGLERFPREMPS